MDFSTLGGNLLGTVPFGDIVLYFTPLNLFLFAVMLGFTLLIAVSKPETQVEATFMKLGNTDVKVGPKEFKQRRFLSVICGIASAGAMITGDLFNFTLFMALIGDETCDHCHGDGAEPGSKVETCPECHGSGYVRFTQNTMFGQMVNERPCSKCHGEGKIISNPCKECRGKGTVKKNKRLKVKIPAGVDNGSRLRVSGEGEAGAKGGQSGDLYVYLYVKPHKFFERDGTTVLCEVPVNIVQATLGAEIKVPTLDGQVTVKVPEGTQPGKVLRLKGKGIPSLRGGQRGDQLVRIKVVVPTKLNEKQKEALRSFGEISKDNISPEEKSFFNKIKNLFK